MRSTKMAMTLAMMVIGDDLHGIVQELVLKLLHVKNLLEEVSKGRVVNVTCL